MMEKSAPGHSSMKVFLSNVKKLFKLRATQEIIRASGGFLRAEQGETGRAGHEGPMGLGPKEGKAPKAPQKGKGPDFRPAPFRLDVG